MSASRLISFDPAIDLQDESLFGNEVAEDATDLEFRSYYYERQESSRFSGIGERLLIVKAYKGEGKSALLRRSIAKAREFKTNLVIERKGHHISPDLETDDYGAWVREWKRIILNNFAYEIGSTIGMAWSDDAISLVEEAEKQGFKENGFLMSVLKRFGIEISTHGIKVKLEKPGIGNDRRVDKIIQRWSAKNFYLWLFVDDIDKNFENKQRHTLKISSFFDAIRDLHGQLDNLYIRTTIRPNVWTILCRKFESLSHVRQYLVDLPWSQADIEFMLYWRVRGYLYRKGLWNRLNAELKGSESEKRRQVVGLIFQDPMRWGDGSKPPSTAITTLSKKRPRWAVELSKMAGSIASANNHKRIFIEDLLANLDQFGKKRLDDMMAEFESQCPALESILVLFRHAKEEMDTEELLRYLKDNLGVIVDLSISGILGRPTERDVASFLFEIGFIYGKKYQDGGYEHFTFADRPFFVKSVTASENDLWWEIHPCYRQTLEIRGSDGRSRMMAKQPGR